MGVFFVAKYTIGGDIRAVPAVGEWCVKDR